MSGSSAKRVLLIIGGGIAAYKALDLIRRLREQGIAVRAVMTRGGAAIRHAAFGRQPLRRARSSPICSRSPTKRRCGHIELSRDADLIVVAPATADLLAKMAHGLADDLASTLLLATDKQILVAPAMNLRMWLATPTRAAMSQPCARDGVIFVGPDDGDMACGEYGPGRMSEPLDDSRRDRGGARRRHSLPCRCRAPAGPAALDGRRVVVTSGPTHEPIDPVRYIANRSSGKQGHAIAAAAPAAGAERHAGLRAGGARRSVGRHDRRMSRPRARCGGGRGGSPGRYFHRRRGGRRLAAAEAAPAEAQERQPRGRIP